MRQRQLCEPRDSGAELIGPCGSSGTVPLLPQPPVWSPASPGSLSALPPVLAAQVKALGYDGNSPPSVPSWLDSLGLQDYVHSFLSSGYSSIDTVKNLWELELVNVSTALRRPGWSVLSMSVPGCPVVP